MFRDILEASLALRQPPLGKTGRSLAQRGDALAGEKTREGGLTMPQVMIKACTKCGRIQPLTNFHKRKPSPDGLAYACKSCVAVRGRIWFAANRERRCAASRVWTIANRERVAMMAHTRYIANPEKAIAATRAWRIANPERRKANHRNERARKAGATGVVTVEEFATLKDYCLCCGRDDVLITVDHIVPISKGGLHHISNLQPLCKSCNSRKGTKTDDYRLGEHDNGK